MLGLLNKNFNQIIEDMFKESMRMMSHQIDYEKEMDVILKINRF